MQLVAPDDARAPCSRHHLLRDQHAQIALWPRLTNSSSVGGTYHLAHFERPVLVWLANCRACVDAYEWMRVFHYGADMCDSK